jgi:hypothetical protein
VSGNSVPKYAGGKFPADIQEKAMNLILIILVLFLLFGGGGYWGYKRW